MTKKNNQNWFHNSELYLTLREMRREMPKLNLTFDFNIAKPIKPVKPGVSRILGWINHLRKRDG